MTITLAKLAPAIQHYEWGGTEFIPQLLQRPNPQKRPFAELWFGAHTQSPSMVLLGNRTMPLSQWIATAPQSILGEESIHRFGVQLPYLFKVLDARKMLSIQVHPSKALAEEGFARENNAAISLDAPHRLYRDDNHKPEAHIAQGDFWLLHGFRDPNEIMTSFSQNPSFNELLPLFADTRLRTLYHTVMELPQDTINRILTALCVRLQPAFRAGQLKKSTHDYWAARACLEFVRQDGQWDRGIIAIYFLNLIGLKAGQGTFQPAGLPHAYLEGVTIELMANSDNVVRGGLTSKYIDLPELLRITNFTSSRPELLKSKMVSDEERVYRTSAPDFLLSQIRLSQGQRYQCAVDHGPDCYLLLNGQVQAVSERQTLKCCRGEAFFAPAVLAYHLQCESDAVLFKASVPL